MKSEPVLFILGALGAVLAGISQAPIPPPWGLVASGASIALAALITRSKVTPTAKLPK